MSRVTVDDGMMISAVRYALGRATYIVGSTIAEVRASWAGMSENARRVIERDVRDASGGPGTVGMDMDDRAWRELLTWIENDRACGATHSGADDE